MSGIAILHLKGDQHELLSVRLIDTDLVTARGAQRRARTELVRRGYPPLKHGWKPKPPVQSPRSWLCEWRRECAR
jgi:hypothetical protein